MKLAFMGHLSVDINVVKGVSHTTAGGGIFYGSVAAHRLGAEAVVYTKCAVRDRHRFDELSAAGVRVVFLDSETSTSIQNDYPTDNPDDRTSRLLSGAAPFTAADLDQVEGDTLHVNPLWLGEFPPALLQRARQRFGFLGGDAQGFLRAVGEDGQMSYQDWSDKARDLPLFDLLKVDLKEARALTGAATPRAAIERLHALGVRGVLLTHKDGVCASDGERIEEAAFGPYSIEGRTGRGDTCTAAFLVARARMSLAEACAFAARITTEKMGYKGPYRP